MPSGGSLRDGQRLFLGTSSVRAMPFAYGLAKASQGVLMILDAGSPWSWMGWRWVEDGIFQ